MSTKRFAPIERGNTLKSIVEALHKYIIGGKLPPGTELTAERQLADELGVSRFSLREALRIAEAEGLVEIQQGRRPRVAVPSSDAAAKALEIALRRSKKSLVQLVDARKLLECEVAKLAAEQISPSELAQLEKSIRSMLAHRGNHASCVSDDINFHNVILKASKQLVFHAMLLSVTPLLRQSRMKTFGRVGVDRAVKGHQAILVQLRKHDGEGAAQAMQKHLEMTREDLRD